MSRYYDRQGNVTTIDKVFGPGVDRSVAHTQISDKVRVSTVHLGVDHSSWGGTPLIFETMIFGGTFDQDCERYSTEEKAKAGHEVMVAKARAAARKEQP